MTAAQQDKTSTTCSAPEALLWPDTLQAAHLLQEGVALHQHLNSIYKHPGLPKPARAAQLSRPRPSALARTTRVRFPLTIGSVHRLGCSSSVAGPIQMPCTTAHLNIRPRRLTSIEECCQTVPHQARWCTNLLACCWEPSSPPRERLECRENSDLCDCTGHTHPYACSVACHHTISCLW